MSIAGVESNILTTIMNLVKNTIRQDALTVEDIKKVADDNIKFHKSIVECFDKFADKDMSTFISTFIRQTAKDKHGFIKAYNSLTNQYTGKAKSMETSLSFSPIYTANKTMIKILSEIRDNAEQLFEEKVVNIHNCRISGALAIGILKQSDLLSDFSCVLWTEMINLISSVPQDTLKYKVAIIHDNVDKIATMVSDICAKEGRYSFLKEVQNLKRQNNDLLLYSNGNVFTKYVGQSKIGPVAIGLGALAAILLGVIAAPLMGKEIDDWHYRRYLKRKDMHEWMLSYSAILKYELQQKDPASPEYQKLLKVIQAYDEKIAKYAKQIKEYEEED